MDAAAIAERQQRLRDIYVRRAGPNQGHDYVSIAGQLIPIDYYKRHYQAAIESQQPGGPFEKYNFRMIDAIIDYSFFSGLMQLVFVFWW